MAAWLAGCSLSTIRSSRTHNKQHTYTPIIFPFLLPLPPPCLLPAAAAAACPLSSGHILCLGRASAIAEESCFGSLAHPFPSLLPPSSLVLCRLPSSASSSLILLTSLSQASGPGASCVPLPVPRPCHRIYLSAHSGSSSLPTFFLLLFRSVVVIHPPASSALRVSSSRHQTPHHTTHTTLPATGRSAPRQPSCSPPPPCRLIRNPDPSLQPGLYCLHSSTTLLRCTPHHTALLLCLDASTVTLQHLVTRHTPRRVTIAAIH